MKFLKVLKFYENFEFLKKKNEIFKFVKKNLTNFFNLFNFMILKFFENFQIL